MVCICWKLLLRRTRLRKGSERPCVDSPCFELPPTEKKKSGVSAFEECELTYDLWTFYFCDFRSASRYFLTYGLLDFFLQHRSPIFSVIFRIIVKTERRLQETHWSTSSEFIVQGWRAVHSGSKARADGVLTLFHPRHKADTIRHEEIQQGRVLRTQLQTPHGRVEVFNCYQFPHNFTVNPTILRDKRQTLLSKLGRAVAGIPLRATLIIAGDFQAEVKPAAPHVGRSTCNTPFHTGADALDPDALNTFLESHGLTALNTWCGPPQPTQFNQAPNKKIGTGTSQIDFIITKLNTADTQAKRVKVSKPPVLEVAHWALWTRGQSQSHESFPVARAQSCYHTY